MIELYIDMKKGIFVNDLETEKKYVINPSSVFRLRKRYKHLKNRQLVVGFIGPRGSGKSVGTARMAILDYLLEGKRVWSNMDICCRLICSDNQYIELKAEPWHKLDIVGLDELYANGCLVVEEANMTMMEARRAMRNENLRFSYVLQQLRKRKMNLIWNAQSEMHVDDRLRWQTDVFVKCMDVSLMPKHHNVGVGELTLCKYYDYSGMVTGRQDDNARFLEPFRSFIVANKPWWNSFNTYELQLLDDENDTRESEPPADNRLTAVADIMENLIRDEKKITKRDVWDIFEVTKHKDRIDLGILLAGRGVKTDRKSKYFYIDEETAISE